MSINRASSIFGVVSWVIERAKQPHQHTIVESAASINKSATADLTTDSRQSASTERQRSMNDFLSCILDNVRVLQRRHPKFDVSAVFMGNNPRTTSHQPATIEHPLNVINFCGGSIRYTAINCIVLFLN